MPVTNEALTIMSQLMKTIMSLVTAAAVALKLQKEVNGDETIQFDMSHIELSKGVPN
jgi:hypothetical protein